MAEDGSIAYLMAKVVRISEEYANINTDLNGVELGKYGITDQKIFTVKYGERTIRALLGKDYSDVAKGDWVALIEEDGNLQLAISFGHAATDIGCSIGDTLYIESLRIQ
jgi:S-adenosylmethionine hydrolase